MSFENNSMMTLNLLHFFLVTSRKLIRQNQALEQKETQDDDNVIIKSRESTPKLLHTVLRVVRPDSYTASLIRRSSRTISRSTMDIPSTASFSPGGVWSWTPSPRLQCSSASLEVPTKSSRRSSLEVPSNASRAPIAKTSMSESLPEEDEEEFLVVETSELYEGGGEAYPPGSPASQHSISLHRRSRSTTPQSVFSHASPPSGAPSPTDYFYSEQGGTSACEPYRPQSSSYSFTEHCVGSPILERKMSFETKSANISLKSSSSLSRYSTATLTRQLCVTKHEDEPSLSLSTGCEASVPLSHEAQFIRGHLESDIATFGEINNVSSTVNSSNCSISNNQKEQSSNNQQSHHGMRSSSKSGETRCNYEIASDVEHSRHPSKNKKTKSSNEDQTTDTRRNNNKKSHTRTSSSNKGNTKSNSASSKSNSKCNDNMKADQSKKSKRSVKPSSSGSVSSGKKFNSISKQKNDTRKDSSTHTMKRSQNYYDLEKGNSSLSERSSPSVNHSVLANHNERPSSSRYSSRNITHEENQLSLLNTTTTCTTSSSTDDIIFKFGLTTSNDHGTYQETSNCLGCSDGDSYDLFLSELTKTMSSKKKSSGTGPSSRTSSASLIEPLSPSGHSASRVYCSAIVHRECTPSPETSPSPFEAKESHL
ncbi:hypothetical protein SK128_003333 [Halocaridina rubra]|uniref:Uncharacterized protein n=1 Tax=Halocaridina rubra TaxID=373956 RepID=A0AAN9A6T9_HALRR